MATVASESGSTPATVPALALALPPRHTEGPGYLHCSLDPPAVLQRNYICIHEMHSGGILEASCIFHLQVAAMGHGILLRNVIGNYWARASYATGNKGHTSLHYTSLCFFLTG